MRFEVAGCSSLYKQSLGNFEKVMQAVFIIFLTPLDMEEPKTLYDMQTLITFDEFFAERTHSLIALRKRMPMRNHLQFLLFISRHIVPSKTATFSGAIHLQFRHASWRNFKNLAFRMDIIIELTLDIIKNCKRFQIFSNVPYCILERGFCESDHSEFCQ